MVLLLVLGCVVVVGAMLQRASGTGLGLLLAPVFTLALGPSSGVLVTNAVTAVSATLLFVGVRWNVDWARWRLLVAGALVGIPPGALLVAVTPAAVLQIGIGATVFAGLAATMWVRRPPRVPARGGALATGVLGGFLNVTSGVAAAATVVYARASRWDHWRYAATLQPTFAAFGALSVAAKLATGTDADLEALSWWFVPVCLAGVLAGARLGSALAARVGAETARTAAVLLAGTGAVATVVRGIGGL